MTQNQKIGLRWLIANKKALLAVAVLAGFVIGFAETELAFGMIKLYAIYPFVTGLLIFPAFWLTFGAWFGFLIVFSPPIVSPWYANIIVWCTVVATWPIGLVWAHVKARFDREHNISGLIEQVDAVVAKFNEEAARHAIKEKVQHDHTFH